MTGVIADLGRDLYQTPVQRLQHGDRLAFLCSYHCNGPGSFALCTAGESREVVMQRHPTRAAVLVELASAAAGLLASWT
jgi:hypothetical protein